MDDTQFSNRRILVVDDEKHIRDLLKQELSESGYIVKEAEDGKKALEMIRKEIPDLLILDVMMPEMTGFEVLDAVDRERVDAVLSAHGLTACTHNLGTVTANSHISMYRGGRLVFAATRDVLQQAWSETSYRIQALRDNPATAREEFERVLDLGRQTERWINLFGTHEPVPEAGQAGNLDQLVARAESLLREQARQGDVSESAAKALEKALDALHRRARQAPDAGAGRGVAPREESGPSPDNQ